MGGGHWPSAWFSVPSTLLLAGSKAEGVHGKCGPRGRGLGQHESINKTQTTKPLPRMVRRGCDSGNKPLIKLNRCLRCSLGAQLCYPLGGHLTKDGSLLVGCFTQTP